MIGVEGAYAVAAGMHTEASSQGGCASKDEEGVEAIEDKRNEWVASQAVIPCRRNEVEERQHGENGDKDVVVDSGWVARARLSYHGGDEGQCDEDEEELQSS